MYKFNLICLCKYCCEKICNPHRDTFNKKWKTSEAQGKHENNWTWVFFFKIALCEHVSKKKSAHSLVDAWSFFLVHSRFTPSEGPKAFKTHFLRRRTMEVGPWTRTIEKGHLPWSDFMVHSANRPKAPKHTFN